MVILNEMAECRESAQLLIALVHLPLLVFGLPYILWCVSCLRRVVAFWVKPGVLVVVVANSDTNLRMCNNISNASLVHYNYWCAYYSDTCHGHSSIRITLDTRHGHTNLALFQPFYYAMSIVKSGNEESSSSGLIVKMTGSIRISHTNSFSASSFCMLSACSAYFFQFSTVTFPRASCLPRHLLVPISIQSGCTDNDMEEDVPLHDPLCKPLRLIQTVYISDSSYPTYRRPNNGLVANVRGHPVGNEFVVLYCEERNGHDAATLEIWDGDEIDYYINSRYVSPPEAVWR
ncbi:hypothetical protein AGLY_016568 [Aphis glycines]|uniref:Uncharacterized protein n=1 Tax=Aphis glycines TaxID=307491 RepID=A0A6G0SZ55_APHGL|nr:hypothetical protein AGLY_016568 [Aphis glycines]